MPFLCRLFVVPAIAAGLLLGAATPSFAAGHATHTGNCGKSTSQTHQTPHATWTMTCPSKPHHPNHPAHPTTPTTNASGTNAAPGQSVRTSTPGWTNHHK
jgi:hypothetical protein